MQDKWLSELDTNSAVIVPTRSLANELNERVAKYFLSSGQSVWVTPTILIWSDYLRLLWQLNRDSLCQRLNVHSLISTQQSAVLWTQIVEASRRSESELTLLNVQQTTKAIQRSWKLMHDWQINAEELEQDHVADTKQFVNWTRAYRKLLDTRSLLDDQLLISALIDMPDTQHPFKALHIVSYDLLTAAQQRYLSNAQANGVIWQRSKPSVEENSTSYLNYDDNNAEIAAALNFARECLEQDSEHKISIVIPDLAHRQTQIQELARDIFYAGESPLSMQESHSVYGFSLGQSLIDLPAIEAALSAISLLKNKTNAVEFGFLLRNQFLGFSAQHREAGRLFEQWLKHNRIHTFLFDQVPSLYEQCIEHFEQASQPMETSLLPALQTLVEMRQDIALRLTSAKESSGYAALRFTEWLQVFGDWLGLWQWRTTTQGSKTNSVQYQLETRWKALLEEFASLSTVQQRAGLVRALELLQQMARNTVFFPKSADSPILISGVFEAIGRQVDTCIFTGMHQDYPAPPTSDAFISNRFLSAANHPEATAESGFLHAQSVINNLLDCAKNRRISYSSSNQQNREISMQASPLFRHVNWEYSAANQTSSLRHEFCLEQYQDTHGRPWLEPELAIFQQQRSRIRLRQPRPRQCNPPFIRCLMGEIKN